MSRWSIVLLSWLLVVLNLSAAAAYDGCEHFNCSANAQCVSNNQSPYCSCKNGYSGSPCSDINECQIISGPCVANAECENTPGSYNCTCKSGYFKNGHLCSARMSCPDGWSLYQDGRKCVKVMVGAKKRWARARKDCQAEGGDLLAIPDTDTMTFVQGLNCPKYCWVGLRYRHRNATWKWLDYTLPATYTFWNSNEPNNRGGKENCVEIIGKRQSQWNDKKCSKKRDYICQRSLGNGP